MRFKGGREHTRPERGPEYITGEKDAPRELSGSHRDTGFDRDVEHSSSRSREREGPVRIRKHRVQYVKDVPPIRRVV